MKNKIFRNTLAVSVLFLTVFGLLFFWWSLALSPVCSVNCQNQVFVVYKGEGISSVADRLNKAKFIRDPFVFKAISFYLKINNQIQAGDYRLSPQMSVSEIAKELTHGTIDVWVTLVEGWRREQTAEKIAQSGLDNFDKKEFLEKTKNLEGELFPDTYLIPKIADTAKIIDIITRNFNKKVESVPKNTLILASIIEREVPHQEDRPIIAGILLKRLKASWPLQIDATVQYALASAKCMVPLQGEQSTKCDWWPKNLTKTDLLIKSPYNSYLNRGLPPAPSSSPGLDAIKAAQNPVQTDYWYYLSDSSGITHYAKTIEEHNQNIQKYLLNN